MTRRAKGAEREQMVVDAASEVIAEQGLAELRLADVARRAGMSVGHVTYYFPAKSQLLVRAIQQSEEESQHQVGDALRAVESPWERFCLLIERAAADGPGDRGWLLWFEVWANAATDDDVALAQRALEGWWRATMAAIVADGIDTGDFSCDDPERAVAVLSALTDGLSVRVALGGGMSRQSLLDLVLDTARQLLGVRQ